MTEQTYYAGSIYVIRPSKIVDIDGKIVKNKINGNEKIIQKANFESTITPVIAHKSLLHGFYDVFKENGQNHPLPKNKVQYYNALDLKEYGIVKDDEEKYFYNVFNGDIVLLSDYLFGYNYKEDFMSKIDFFKQPFNNSLELKSEISQKLIRDKQYYTIEELQNILNDITKHVIEPVNITKTYRIPKK